ncbi:MAG: flagellar basal body rod protein FlgC [Lachnospiraceae bacterium]|nr:flagellar basal body rod protein FlgC [Lachnospiraceae bacterium]MBQ8262101.1 flagellar basal body rod protein FlgC [Lachnospiraceae bacterium]
MGMFTSFDISATGLSAQRYRMDTIAENVANANTTRTEDGTPYRRKVVTFTTQETENVGSFSHVLDNIVGEGRTANRNSFDGAPIGYGVKITEISEDHETEMNMVYDPSHPDADENGYVTYPNVNIITEMTNLIDASRAYEANATAFQASKTIAMKGIDLASQV